MSEYVDHPTDEWIRKRGIEARKAMEHARKAGLKSIAADLERKAIAFEKQLDRVLRDRPAEVVE